MADGTKIEWTQATWNPVTGCSVTSPGCTNCYAMKLAGTRLQHHPSRAGLTHQTKAGPVWTGEVRFNDQWLDQPLRWKKPRLIFVCAHGDLFHESVPDEWIDRVFAVMALAPQHTFQVLTKRSARMRAYLNDDAVVRRICETAGKHHRAKPCFDEGPEFSAGNTRSFRERMREWWAHVGRLTAWTHEGGAAFSMWVQRDGAENWRHPSWVDWPLPNIWLGVSVEDQTRAHERVPDLHATPAASRWLSCEPLLEEILFDPCDLAAFDWVVVGGESGAAARPMQADWARSLRDQCAVAGVPFFFKQWGNYRPTSDCEHGEYMIPATKTEAGRLLDGVLHDAMPEVSHG